MRNNWGRRDRGTRVPRLTDRVAIVQLGFRSRPLRDGGGKPSPTGRLNPPFRTISPLATLGALIMTLVRMSLASGATTHPFQEADLAASLSGDPVWEFPLTLKEGVPLGVSDPTLTFPGVWPTKEELKGEAWLGEDPPPPVAHDNYPTAELFAKEIESTFYEERALDMVDGPFTRSEAAERCRCKPEEKTTAPMVGDCLHAIHWLRTAADHPHLLQAPSSGTDEEPRDVHQPVQGQSPGVEGPERAPACPQVPRALIGAGG